MKGRLGPQAQGELEGIPFPATFPVAHVDLVASAPSPHGHVYTTLARAELNRRTRTEAEPDVSLTPTGRAAQPVLPLRNVVMACAMAAAADC